MSPKDLELCRKQADKITTKLKRIRESKKISKNELSQRTGLARSAILRIETSQRQPSLLNVLKLCHGLGITFEELLSEG